MYIYLRMRRFDFFNDFSIVLRHFRTLVKLELMFCDFFGLPRPRLERLLELDAEPVLLLRLAIFSPYITQIR